MEQFDLLNGFGENLAKISLEEAGFTPGLALLDASDSYSQDLMLLEASKKKVPFEDIVWPDEMEMKPGDEHSKTQQELTFTLKNNCMA